MTLAFGAVSFPVGRERRDAVRFLELILAGGVAGTLGLLLALVWTAGFVPTFLEPSAASVLLAKPVARWQLLLGKYLGVLTFVGFQVVLFVVLTWLALGVRTDVWDLTYWWCIPLLLAPVRDLLQLLGPARRGHPQHGGVRLRLRALLAPGLGDQLRQRDGSRPAGIPVPADRHAGPDRGGVLDFPQTDRRGTDPVQRPGRTPSFREAAGLPSSSSPGTAFSPQLSILSSLVITGVLLALSAYEFNATDY